MKLYLDLDGTLVNQNFKKINFIKNNIETIKKQIKGKKIDSITVLSYSIINKIDEEWFNKNIKPTIQNVFNCNKVNGKPLQELWDEAGLKFSAGKKEFFIAQAILDNATEAICFDDSFYKNETIIQNGTTIKLYKIGINAK